MPSELCEIEWSYLYENQEVTLVSEEPPPSLWSLSEVLSHRKDVFCEEISRD